MTPTHSNTSSSSNNVPDNNPLKRRWDEQGETATGRRQRTAEVGLAVARALGSRPTPRTKFWAAYADGSRVHLADARRGKPPTNLPGPSPSSPAHVERPARRTAGGLAARYEAFCRGRPNHWRTLAVVERHNPEEPGFNPERPLHVHALSISTERKGEWNTQNARFWDFEGNHPNVSPKDLKEGPGGCPTRTAFHYLWKAVGEEGESIDDLMAGELTEEAMEEILVKGKGGKRSQMQADLEDGAEIVSTEDREEYYRRYKCLRPLQMTTAWNSVRAYAEYAYKEDVGHLPPIPVELPHPEIRTHVDQADQWFEQEVPRKAPGQRHRILVIEGATGTGKMAYARAKGTHSQMCNVWNVGALSENANVWILDDMVHTNRRYSLKALSQYKADFTGRYKHVNTMKVRPMVILGNSRAAIMKCWSDIEGEEGDAWVAGNVDWVYAGQAPFFVFP